MKPEAYEKNYAFEDRYWWFTVRNRIVLDAVRRHTTGAGLNILDYGCGTGKMLELLAEFGTAHGADVSPEALEFCRSRGLSNLSLISRDGPPQGPFDLITLLDVIEHVEDDARLVRSLCERLTPGGILLITAPALPCMASGEDYVSEHKRRYTAATLRRALNGSGLNILRLTYFNSLLLPAIFLHIRTRALINPESLKHSNLQPLPPAANAVLRAVFGMERALLRFTGLPVGMSLLCIARKDPPHD